MVEYCTDLVEEMGVDAEGFIVDVGILPTILDFRSYLCYLDQGDSASLNILRTVPSAQHEIEQPHKALHILLQPGMVV